jgi:hypothetical protein
MPRLPVDLEKVRAELPRMKRGSLLILVERALDLVPRSKLQELLKGHIKADLVDVPKRGDVPKRADAPKQAAKTSVLAEVKRFHAAATARKYYEGFNVNSKNFREKSPGGVESHPEGLCRGVGNIADVGGALPVSATPARSLAEVG